MNKINLLSICILNSKYKVIYNTIFYILLLFLLNFENISYCMVTDEENNEIIRNSAEILNRASSGDQTLEILLLENQIDLVNGQNETLRLQNEQLQNEVINLRNAVSIQQQEIRHLTVLNNNISENYRELHRASRELQIQNQNLNAQIVALNQRILDLLQNQR